MADEAEDLAHDIILSLLRRGSSFEGPRRLVGAARRHAAFVARSAGRRRAREARYADERATVDDVAARVGTEDGIEASVSMSGLSPALRTTLLLLLQQLEKPELRVALGISDTALRKRFQALKAHRPLVRPKLPLRVRTPLLVRLRRCQVELLPRLATGRATWRVAPRAVAFSDPDGHGIVFAQQLTSGATAATTGQPCSTLRSRTSRSSSS